MVLNEGGIGTLIENIRPDVVVKGKEYEFRENEELKTLQTYGGKLVFSSGEVGFSFTEDKPNQFMLGDIYTIVDMAVWGWTRMIEKVIAVGELEKRKNLKRLMEYIKTRPASHEAEKISERNNHQFKIEIDDEASKHMFPQNLRLK